MVRRDFISDQFFWISFITYIYIYIFNVVNIWFNENNVTKKVIKIVSTSIIETI